MSKEFNVVPVSGADAHTVDDRQGVDVHTVDDQMSMKQKPEQKPEVEQKPFTISYSSQFQNRRNTSYPFNTTITSSDELARVVRFDHVAAVFKDGINTQGNTVRGYRNKKCFQSSDVVIMDCDNTPTDPLSPDIPEGEWKSPRDVEVAFPDVQFYIVYSRNHMKAKDGRAARPKFHVYFPLSTSYTDAGMYQKLKSAVQEQFEWFDPNALSITQFMFGVENPTVEYHPGTATVDEFLLRSGSSGFHSGSDVGQEGGRGTSGTAKKRNRKDRDNQKLLDKWIPSVVEVGHRSNTLSHFAGRVLKRFGESDRAKELFEMACNRCTEPMEIEELDSIWRSARAFYHDTVRKMPSYIEPGEYSDSDDDFNEINDSGEESVEDDLDAPDSGGEGGADDPDDPEDVDHRRAITTADIRRVLRHMDIRIRLNDLTGMAEITGMPPEYSKTNAPNILPVLISDYLKEHHRRCSRQVIDDSLMAIMDENRFNPVQDMLSSTVWDGRDRVKELMRILGIASPADHPDHSNATDSRGEPSGGEAVDDTDGLPTVDDHSGGVGDSHSGGDADADSHSGSTAVGKATLEQTYLKKWLHQCIAMALNDEEAPYGADGVLVIQDEQGAGKTLLFSRLAVYPDWFAEGVSIDLNNKDSIIQSTGCWIAELGELDSTLKREQSALKAFLTSSRDTYRAPYARTQTRKPRRTSFCATVNPKEFLNDETGSRRFWVIHPHATPAGSIVSTISTDDLMQGNQGVSGVTTELVNKDANSDLHPDWMDTADWLDTLHTIFPADVETGSRGTGENGGSEAVDTNGSEAVDEAPTGGIDVEAVKKMSVNWLTQLWRQVYETMYLKDPQGFRLTHEERRKLQAHNNRYEKPLPGEREIMEKLQFDTPVKKWKWCKAGDFIGYSWLFRLGAVAIGRALAKIARSDPRVAVKTVHKTQYYLLPPVNTHVGIAEVNREPDDDPFLE